MDLAGMKRRDLQALCKRHGLPAGGTNADLVARLDAALSGAAGAEEEVAGGVPARKGCLKQTSGDAAEAKKVRFAAEEGKARRLRSRVIWSPVVPKKRGKSAQAGADSAAEDGISAEASADVPVRRSRRNSVSHAEAEEVGEAVAVDRKRKRKSQENDEGVAVSTQVGVSTRVTGRSSLAGATAVLPPAVEKKRGRGKAAGGSNKLVAEVQGSEPDLQKSAQVEASARITRSRTTAPVVTSPTVAENKRRRKTGDAQTNVEQSTVSDVPANNAPVTRSLRNRAVQVNNSMVDETHTARQLENKSQPSRPPTRRSQQVSSSVEGKNQEQIAAPNKAPLLRRSGRNYSEDAEKKPAVKEEVRRSTRKSVVLANDLIEQKNPEAHVRRSMRKSVVPVKDIEGIGEEIQNASSEDGPKQPATKRPVRGSRRKSLVSELHEKEKGLISEKNIEAHEGKSTWKPVMPVKDIKAVGEGIKSAQGKDMEKQFAVKQPTRRSSRKSVLPDMLESSSGLLATEMNAKVNVRRSTRTSVLPNMLNENQDHNKMSRSGNFQSGKCQDDERKQEAKEPIRRSRRSVAAVRLEEQNNGFHEEKISKTPMRRLTRKSVALNAVEKVSMDHTEVGEEGLKLRKHRRSLLEISSFAIDSWKHQNAHIPNEKDNTGGTQQASNCTASKGRSSKRRRTTAPEEVMSVKVANDDVVIIEATKDTHRSTHEHNESSSKVQEICQVNATREEFSSGPLLVTVALTDEICTAQSVPVVIPGPESGDNANECSDTSKQPQEHYDTQAVDCHLSETRSWKLDQSTCIAGLVPHNCVISEDKALLSEGEVNMGDGLSINFTVGDREEQSPSSGEGRVGLEANASEPGKKNLVNVMSTGLHTKSLQHDIDIIAEETDKDVLPMAFPIEEHGEKYAVSPVAVEKTVGWEASACESAGKPLTAIFSNDLHTKNLQHDCDVLTKETGEASGAALPISESDTNPETQCNAIAEESIRADLGKCPSRGSRGNLYSTSLHLEGAATDDSILPVLNDDKGCSSDGRPSSFGLELLFTEACKERYSKNVENTTVKVDNGIKPVTPGFYAGSVCVEDEDVQPAGCNADKNLDVHQGVAGEENTAVEIDGGNKPSTPITPGFHSMEYVTEEEVLAQEKCNDQHIPAKTNLKMKLNDELVGPGMESGCTTTEKNERFVAGNLDQQAIMQVQLGDVQEGDLEKPSLCSATSDSKHECGLPEENTAIEIDGGNKPRAPVTPGFYVGSGCLENEDVQPTGCGADKKLDVDQSVAGDENTDVTPGFYVGSDRLEDEDVQPTRCDAVKKLDVDQGVVEEALSLQKSAVGLSIDFTVGDHEEQSPVSGEGKVGLEANTIESGEKNLAIDIVAEETGKDVVPMAFTIEGHREIYGENGENKPSEDDDVQPTRCDTDKKFDVDQGVTEENTAVEIEGGKKPRTPVTPVTNLSPAEEVLAQEKCNDQHVPAKTDLKLKLTDELAGPCMESGCSIIEKNEMLVSDNLDQEGDFKKPSLCSATPEWKHECGLPEETILPSKNMGCLPSAEQSPFGLESLFSQESIDESVGHGALASATAHTANGFDDSKDCHVKSALENAHVSEPFSHHDTKGGISRNVDCMHTSQQDNGMEGLPEANPDEERVLSAFSLDAKHIKEVINSEEVACEGEGSKELLHSEDLKASSEKTDVHGTDGNAGISDTILSSALHAPTDDNYEICLGSYTDVLYQVHNDRCSDGTDQFASKPLSNDIIEDTSAKHIESGVVLLPGKERSNLKDGHLNSKLEGTKVVESGLYFNKDIGNILDSGSIGEITPRSGLSKDSSVGYRQEISDGFSMEASLDGSSMCGEQNVCRVDAIENPSVGLATPGCMHEGALSEEAVCTMNNYVGTCSSNPREVLMELQSLFSEENIKESYPHDGLAFPSPEKSGDESIYVEVKVHHSSNLSQLGSTDLLDQPVGSSNTEVLCQGHNHKDRSNEDRIEQVASESCTNGDDIVEVAAAGATKCIESAVVPLPSKEGSNLNDRQLKPKPKSLDIMESGINCDKFARNTLDNGAVVAVVGKKTPSSFGYYEHNVYQVPDICAMSEAAPIEVIETGIAVEMSSLLEEQLNSELDGDEVEKHSLNCETDTSHILGTGSVMSNTALLPKDGHNHKDRSNVDRVGQVASEPCTIDIVEAAAAAKCIENGPVLLPSEERSNLSDGQLKPKLESPNIMVSGLNCKDVCNTSEKGSVVVVDGERNPFGSGLPEDYAKDHYPRQELLDVFSVESSLQGTIFAKTIVSGVAGIGNPSSSLATRDFKYEGALSEEAVCRVKNYTGSSSVDPRHLVMDLQSLFSEGSTEKSDLQDNLAFPSAESRRDERIICHVEKLVDTHVSFEPDTYQGPCQDLSRHEEKESCMSVPMQVKESGEFLRSSHMKGSLASVQIYLADDAHLIERDIVASGEVLCEEKAERKSMATSDSDIVQEKSYSNGHGICQSSSQKHIVEADSRLLSCGTEVLHQDPKECNEPNEGKFSPKALVENDMTGDAPIKGIGSSMMVPLIAGMSEIPDEQLNTKVSDESEELSFSCDKATIENFCAGPTKRDLYPLPKDFHIDACQKQEVPEVFSSPKSPEESAKFQCVSVSGSGPCQQRVNESTSVQGTYNIETLNQYHEEYNQNNEDQTTPGIPASSVPEAIEIEQTEMEIGLIPAAEASVLLPDEQLNNKLGNEEHSYDKDFSSLSDTGFQNREASNLHTDDCMDQSSEDNHLKDLPSTRSPEQSADFQNNNDAGSVGLQSSRPRGIDELHAKLQNFKVSSTVKGSYIAMSAPRPKPGDSMSQSAIALLRNIENTTAVKVGHPVKRNADGKDSSRRALQPISGKPREQ